MKVSNALIGGSRRLRVREAAAVFGAMIAYSGPGFAQAPIHEQCGSGTCTLTLAPISVLSNQDIQYLTADMAAQFPFYTVIGGGNVANPGFSAPNFSAYLNQTTGGENFSVNWTGQLPANAAWIQVINTNYNNVGYSDDGGYHTTSTGPGIQQTNVDVLPDQIGPNYVLTAPPYFQDSPGRLLPTAANPLTTWTGQVFLVSEDPSTNDVTVYGGLQWGWKDQYTPLITKVTDTYTLSDANLGGWPFAGATASGTYGISYYSNGQDYLFGDLTVEENVQGTIYTYNFDYNCNSLTPHCGKEPVASQINSGFNVALNIDSYALNGSSSVVPVSFEDFVYDSTGYGTLSEVVTNGIVTPGVPEPSTWAMLIVGFASIALAGHRRAKPRLSSVATIADNC